MKAYNKGRAFCASHPLTFRANLACLQPFQPRRPASAAHHHHAWVTAWVSGRKQQEVQPGVTAAQGDLRRLKQKAVCSKEKKNLQEKKKRHNGKGRRNIEEYISLCLSTLKGVGGPYFKKTRFKCISFWEGKASCMLITKQACLKKITVKSWVKGHPTGSPPPWPT